MSPPSLAGILGSALQALKPKYPYMPFDLATIREEMEAARGTPLSDEEAAQVKPLMMRLWGSGVEPAALGGELWKFGYGRPPVSREIPYRG